LSYIYSHELEVFGMQVTVEEVERIARLAKLSFSAAEKAQFTTEFNQMLAYVDKLNELDLDDVEPTAQPFISGAPLREDAIKPSLPRAEALANAPAGHDGFFSVPKVIGE
jgi:aspartyl-tRNA(Asn)/glutamyl-tRNA(Gln) amidotransferase subunit C